MNKHYTKSTITILPTIILGSLSSLLPITPATAGLLVYDSEIAADHAGGLPYVAFQETPLVFDGTNGESFDFGSVSGSGVIEFIVKGDPEGLGPVGFLGTGANSNFTLRYEQWNDTGALGFTHAGVRDHIFDPPLEGVEDNPLTDSPVELTHLTYRWDHTRNLMELYVNGVLEGARIAPGFVFPSGMGYLGNYEGLTEGMVGTIERVTVYNDALDPTVIEAHAEARTGPAGSLVNYDNTIATDHQGDHPYIGISLTSETFTGDNAAPFDFGAVSDSATAEFVIQGDPVATGSSGFLAVGSNLTYSFRYELWEDSGKLGFTHIGIKDYLFGPPEITGVDLTSSPLEFTHIAYRWDATNNRMELYRDGILAGVNTAATGFELPTGIGTLGNSANLSAGMIGEIARVVVYDELLSPETITAHADAWLGSDDQRPFQISTIGHELAEDLAKVTFTWNSRPGRVYQVESSLDLLTWEVLADDHPSEGETTTFEHTFQATDPDPKRYYRVTIATED